MQKWAQVMEAELTKKMKYAAKWSSLGEICAKLIAPVTNAILARLLNPEAFGVVATLTMVVSFAEIFTDAGFQKYLVQHEFTDEADLELGTNVAFWTNLMLSLVLWAGIAAFATPISNLVGAPGCEMAIVVMSGEIPLLAFSSIQMACYRRDFDFKGLFQAKIATALIPLVITVPLTLIFRSYWALVLGTLGKDLVNAVLLTARSRWKPSLLFSLSKLKEMLSFSLWTVAENISTWLTLNLDVFLVGTVLSTYHLGLYKTSISTVNSVMNLVTGASMPVLFSALSRCQNQKVAFRDVFYRFQRTIAILVLPLGVGIYLYRELVTTILLGNQWGETADFLGMWALSSAITVVFHNPNSEAFRSRGNPKLCVLTQLFHIAALVPVVLWAMGQGYETLTLARSLVRLEMVLVSSTIAYFALKLNPIVSFRNMLPQLVSTLAMALTAILLRDRSNSVLWQVGTIFLCALVYGITMLLIPEGRKQLAGIVTGERRTDDIRRENNAETQS